MRQIEVGEDYWISSTPPSYGRYSRHRECIGTAVRQLPDGKWEFEVKQTQPVENQGPWPSGYRRPREADVGDVVSRTHKGIFDSVEERERRAKERAASEAAKAARLAAERPVLDVLSDFLRECGVEVRGEPEISDADSEPHITIWWITKSQAERILAALNSRAAMRVA